MLTLYHNGEQYPLQDTEYYVRELANGLDEIIFTLSIYDPIYAIMSEEEAVVDRAGQRYKIKQIDAGASDAKVICQLDIDDWKSTLNVEYNSGSKTVLQQLNAVKPTGWVILDRSSISIARTIEGDLTPYDVCVECTGVYNVYIRWDNVRKECTIYPKAMGAPVGAFASRELNLKEINYKGKSNDLITRLYAYGKEGLSFADINDNKPYVDNFDYTTEIICGIWRDDRYTDAASLLADAQERLAIMSRPDRSYECAIVDLQATNPELYNNLDFSLFTAATLIDDIKETSIDYQVVERHVYPYHPDKNEVIFNSEPLKITASVVSIADAIENPNSEFQQIQQAKIANATNWLLSGDGYVVAVRGSNDEWKELLFMDTDDISTAQKVIRINENGIGFSQTGVNGPYTNAWTIDGSLNADFITSGTLDADQVTVHGRLEATSGYIGSATSGWDIGSTNIHNGVLSVNGTTGVAGTYVGVDGIRSQGGINNVAYVKIADGQIHCNSNITIHGAGVYANTVQGNSFYAGSEEGASGTLTFPANTSGSVYCYLTVQNGIVTRIGTTQ